MRVEQLILDAENNKVKLELAEAARREAIMARKKETDRLRRMAEERKVRMKKNVGKMKKKVSILKKLIGGLGFGKASSPKSPEGGGEGEKACFLPSTTPSPFLTQHDKRFARRSGRGLIVAAPHHSEEDSAQSCWDQSSLPAEDNEGQVAKRYA